MTGPLLLVVGLSALAGSVAIAVLTLAGGWPGRVERQRLLSALDRTHRLDAEIAPVTDDFARSVADAYDRWGKGVNPAGLNFADCFAYALAMERSCPLLFVGDDFAKTDVVPAIT